MSELSHLDQLEAEAIYIIREVAASCEKPVMLYSIGKDSSVMLHLALKAFYPEKPPFPFLHVNTTWKFKEMIKFRDETAKKYGLEMIEYINEDGVKQGVNPFDSGAAYTDIMKTQALKQALNKYGFTAAFGGGRRDEEKSRAKERIFSFRNENQALRIVGSIFDVTQCLNSFALGILLESIRLYSPLSLIIVGSCTLPMGSRIVTPSP